MSDVLSLAWRRYLRNLKEKPLQTKSATSASLSALSNIIAQRLTSQGPIVWRRVLATAAFGYFFGAPATHFWHRLLDRLFPAAPNGKPDELAPLKKVLLDVVTFGPFFNLVAMVYLSMVVNGQSLRATRQKVRKDFPSVLVNSWKFWPAVHLLNFKFVAPQLRVPFVSTASLFWSVFLITQSRRSVAAIRP